MSIIETVTSRLFKIGDVVPQSGMYVYVPCGFMQYFEASTQFGTCDACLAGTEYGPEGCQSVESEFWQFLG